MANKDMARVVVQLEAEVGRLKKDFDKVERVVQGANDNMVRSTRKAARKMESDMSSAATKITGSFTKAGAAAVAAISAGLSFNELRKTADEYKKIVNTLTVAGVTEAQRGGVLDALTKSAQANAVPLEALASLYGRVSQAQTTLKTTSGELLQFTDLVSQALRVGGTSASEASGALLQMGQALSGGVVRAEEYSSMLEGAYPLLQAVAAGLKEAGGDVSKLSSLVREGKVSSEAFYRAGLAGAQVLQDKLAGAVTTTDQATQRLRNEFTLAVGKFDEAVGLTPALVKGLDGVAGSMAGIGSAATSAVTGVQSLLDKVISLYEANGKVLRQQGLSYQDERARRTDAARAMGTANSGGRDAVAAERAAAEVAASRKAIASFRASEAEFANSYKPPTAAPKTVVPPEKQVSLANFKVPGAKEGGGSGSSSKEKLDAYEKELIAVEKRTKAAQLEAAMVGKSTFEKEKAKAALDLETAAKKANLTVTEEMRQKIEQSATGYANAKVKVEEVKKALESAQEAQRFFGEAITDSLSDLIIDGGKAEDVLKSLVKQLAKAALQAALIGGGPIGSIYGVRA
ncbi:MAG: tape measure protein [Bosea sp.]|uniref:tape measure protein n=1 Tax=Bosea sp. (in: a-proteobacteria) TaxID=1871050 RepID=UPI001ACD4E97|nr:tape measure protein [Bosea sp. (in: a-proteobacteria)]MBN9468979.1 tape measure protein [Bosea sp. (in: a-proteobacteria)]